MDVSAYAMLKKKVFHESGVVIVMSDIAIITASAKATLLEIAKQSSDLGTGLLNAAPGDKTGTPNNSIQYLLATADDLARCAEECEKLLGIAPSSDMPRKPGM